MYLPDYGQASIGIHNTVNIQESYLYKNNIQCQEIEHEYHNSYRNLYALTVF